MSQWNTFLSLELERRNKGYLFYSCWYKWCSNVFFSFCRASQRYPSFESYRYQHWDFSYVEEYVIGRTSCSYWRCSRGFEGMVRGQGQSTSPCSYTCLPWYVYKYWEYRERGIFLYYFSLWALIIPSLASALHACTGTEMLLIAVRSSSDCFNQPYFFNTSEKVSDFFTLTFKFSLWDIVSKLECFCLSGVEGILVSIPYNIADDLFLLLQVYLEDCTLPHTSTFLSPRSSDQNWSELLRTAQNRSELLRIWSEQLRITQNNSYFKNLYY